MIGHTSQHMAFDDHDHPAAATVSDREASLPSDAEAAVGLIIRLTDLGHTVRELTVGSVTVSLGPQRSEPGTSSGGGVSNESPRGYAARAIAEHVRASVNRGDRSGR